MAEKNIAYAEANQIFPPTLIKSKTYAEVSRFTQSSNNNVSKSQYSSQSDQQSTQLPQTPKTYPKRVYLKPKSHASSFI